MEIRQYTNDDISALSRLWISAFGDSSEVPETFFRMLPDMGSCVVGIEDNKIVAMASAMAGQELQHKKSLKKPEVGYIYAVAVDEEYRGRGYGAEISKAAYKLAIEREAMIVCTSPASESLYDFYARTLNFETALYRKKFEVEAADIEMTMALSSTEYYMMRESILSEKTYLRLSNFSMEYLKQICVTSGGGLFASMSGICTAQKIVDTCVIHEMLSMKPEATAASVANSLGCRKCVYYLPSDSKEGEPYLMADKGKIPGDAIWNIIYE